MLLRPPKLFLRMALHIGAALAAFILIGAASLGLIAAWELRGYIETRQSTLGEEAAAVLAAAGEQELVRWLQNDAAIPDDVSIYVLDEDSTDLLGREIPDQYANFIRQSVIGKHIEAGSNFRPVRLAPQLIGPTGEIYSLLVMPKGISLWGSPSTSIGLLLVALLVVGSVAWLIARAFTRPIHELQLTVQELASGDIRARVPAVICERGDELGALAADFNSMAEQLTELIEGRENLMREMSHELRSPLARLHAAIALASERQALDNTVHDCIEQEIHRMNRVIGEMLSYASLDATVSNKNRLMRLDRLLRDLIRVEELEAQNHGCKLVLESQTDLTVLGNPDLLTSGFENILRNAIRYAPVHSAVTITARREPGQQKDSSNIVVAISDCGPGVPAGQLDTIFEPYVRVSSGDHHHDSTGLGLAIVRRVIQLHNGSVTASNLPTGGLTVTVTIPAVNLS
jgi:two-component system OmpR family sensor kinase